MLGKGLLGQADAFAAACRQWLMLIQNGHTLIVSRWDEISPLSELVDM